MTTSPMKLFFLIAAVVSTGCSLDSDDQQAPSAPPAPVISRAEEIRAEDPRPSVVLIVIDTLRADAVSSYGAVSGTTPAMDRLARSGVRYARAYAPAPWTISSHTTLFSGLRVDEHGIGLAGASVAPDSLQMLAEDFREAGYVTAGFSENVLVSSHFGLDQGFDEFDSTDIVKIMRHLNVGEAAPAPFDLVGSVRSWHQQRDKSRPFFLFVNIYDPHDPYTVREENRWVPDDVPNDDVAFIESHYPIGESLCDGLPPKQALEVIRGLYLGDVAAADAKLDKLLQTFETASNAPRNLTIVTADHGEHLGENRLLGHQFSVRNSVLHIPMIISGLPELDPAVVDRPVELRQVRDSLLCWALGEDCPAALPVANGDDTLGNDKADPILGFYSDTISRLPDWMVDQFGIRQNGEDRDASRSRCTEADPVFGDMVSLIRYPMKITWFDKHEPVLHDLSWDPHEKSNQMKLQPERASVLLEELEAFVRAHVLDREPVRTPDLTEDGIRALKSLGYIE